MGQVLHASYSGWFPFCVIDGDASQVGDGKEYPIGMSLVSAMHLYWKVKQWRIQITQGSTPADFTFYREGAFSPTPDPTTEQQLVCNRSIGGDFFPPGFDQIGFSVFNSAPYILKVGSLFYPKLTLAGNIASQTWDSVYETPNETATISLQFGGSSFSLVINKNYTGSLSGSVEEIETWPYLPD